MMKKFLTGVLALALSGALAVPVLADTTVKPGEDGDPSPPAGTTKVSFHVDPAYTVTIPEDVAVVFHAASTPFGQVALTKAQLEPGYGVQVALSASGALKNTKDAAKTIPYTVNSEEGVFTSVWYEAAGQSTALTIDISEEAWNAAYAGAYSDTVTFTVSYGKTAEAE